MDKPPYGNSGILTAALVLWLCVVDVSPGPTAELEVDELIASIRSQILAAEKRARAKPIFQVKEVKLTISYAIDKKGEGEFKAFVITAGASISSHAVQTLEIVLGPLGEVKVERPKAGVMVAEIKDFRGRSDYTPEDIAKSLFAEVKVRGLGPTGPVEARPAVALNVRFEPGSARISPQYYPDLDKVGKVLTLPEYAEFRLELAGHTDNIGAPQANQLISWRRAESVKRYLVERFHLDPQRFVVKGYGEAQPMAPNDTPEGRSVNRRVELVNLGRG
jgi:outer membrane protein OmpA-like peptidoglycan-associated protein